MICDIEFIRTRPFGEAAAHALRALPYAHRAEEDAVIGVAQLVANVDQGSTGTRARGLIRLGRVLFEDDYRFPDFEIGTIEHTANRQFARDPHWLGNVGIRDWRPRTSVATVACGLRDALVLRNETPLWGGEFSPEQRLKDLTDACEVYLAKDLSNHALIEVKAGVETFLRADLSCSCDVPLDEISIRLIPSPEIE